LGGGSQALPIKMTAKQSNER
jgi:hypothetical protein